MHGCHYDEGYDGVLTRIVAMSIFESMHSRTKMLRARAMQTLRIQLRMSLYRSTRRVGEVLRLMIIFADEVDDTIRCEFNNVILPETLDASRAPYYEALSSM